MYCYYNDWCVLCVCVCVLRFLQCMLGYVTMLSKALTDGEEEAGESGGVLQNLLKKAYLVVDKVGICPASCIKESGPRRS